MPPFLSTREESKSSSSDLCVRYALSAFEDLNSAIRSLRRCFGFPYQEYIGYLNTLTHTHRARREHEALIDRLRRWAIFGNVDAVVWIDYAKANQPPGSFKMGPRDSRPFSAAHMELCTHTPSGSVFEREENDGDNSEASWSEIEQEGASGTGGAAGGHAVHDPSPAPATDGVSGSGQRQSRRGSFVLQLSGSTGPVPLKRLGASSARRATPRTRRDTSPATKLQSARENSILRTLIQEEVIPAYGSIYTRSIAPGPGYYGAPGANSLQDVGPGFGHRPKGRIDAIVDATKELPGPGEYSPRTLSVEEKAALGRFGRAPKLVLPSEISRKLPFISSVASERETHSVHSPALFHTVPDDAPCLAHGVQKSPEYSFCKSRRPF